MGQVGGPDDRHLLFASAHSLRRLGSALSRWARWRPMRGRSSLVQGVDCRVLRIIVGVGWNEGEE